MVVKPPMFISSYADMVPVVQLVRASDCGSECRGFESHRAPNSETLVSEKTYRGLLFLPFPFLMEHYIIIISGSPQNDMISLPVRYDILWSYVQRVYGRTV